MSKNEKLLEKLKNKPKSFKYDELRKVMSFLGYEESTQGKTSGSRVAFIHQETKHIIRLHKPHPGNELKEYQIKLVIQELETWGLI